MKFINTNLEGVIVIEPTVFGDNRGWFMESYNQELFIQNGIKVNFIQDNHSFSLSKGTLRGLHYQMEPKAQTKLVRCTKGAIYDVAVDIRVGSLTYGQWFGIELSAENKKQLLVPKGFAHGFITLTEDTEVQYKVDELYSPEHDRGITYKDSTININWPFDGTPILSDKDRVARTLQEVENDFTYNGTNK